MPKTLNYLNIITAIALSASVIFKFVVDLVHQSNFAGFDGPLAHYMGYAFSINKIILAIFLSVVLLFDFEIHFKKSGKLLLQLIGGICAVFSLIGFGFIVKQHLFSGHDWQFMELYLFQTAYLLISIIILRKGIDAGKKTHA